MFRIIRIFTLLVLLLAALPAQGQLRQRDTVLFRPAQLIAPGVLIGSGVAIHVFAHQSVDVAVRDMTRNWHPAGAREVGDELFRYLMVVPLVVDVGLGITGVPSKHDLTDRFIEAGIASALVGGTSLLLKGVIESPRPDASGSNSFPSGHTGLAFMGAELMRIEYGWVWGLTAYVVASSVAVLRCYHDRHWLSDVLLGAGIGILGAHAGEWLLDPVKRLLRIQSPIPGTQAALAPTLDPMNGAFCATLALRF